LIRQRWAAPLNAYAAGKDRWPRNARTSFGALRMLRQSSVRFLLALIIVAAGCGGQINAYNTMKELMTNVDHWLRVFESSQLYRHDTGRLFDDFLDLVLCSLTNQRQEARYLATAKRYDREELNTIAQLFGGLITIHEAQTAERKWYDALGEIYQYLASRSKASRMGQFFTPASVCDLMAEMTLGKDREGTSICDPACGSGRTLLAAYAIHPKLTTIAGADLDPICAKMCALNFWLHGIRGEVACMNSLSQEWYHAYITHPRLSWPFVVFLDEARKEDSLLYVRREQLVPKAVPAAPVMLDLFNQPEA
jgi:type I restriction enzyme M protein